MGHLPVQAHPLGALISCLQPRHNPEIFFQFGDWIPGKSEHFRITLKRLSPQDQD